MPTSTYCEGHNFSGCDYRLPSSPPVDKTEGGSVFGRQEPQLGARSSARWSESGRDASRDLRPCLLHIRALEAGSRSVIGTWRTSYFLSNVRLGSGADIRCPQSLLLPGDYLCRAPMPPRKASSNVTAASATDAACPANRVAIPCSTAVPDRPRPAADQEDLSAPPGRDLRQLRMRDARKRELISTNFSQRCGIGQHDGHSPFCGGREQSVPLQIRLFRVACNHGPSRSLLHLDEDAKHRAAGKPWFDAQAARMSLIPAASKSAVRKKDRSLVPCSSFFGLPPFSSR